VVENHNPTHVQVIQDLQAKSLQVLELVTPDKTQINQDAKNNDLWKLKRTTPYTG
jgi:hypothetical protein